MGLVARPANLRHSRAQQQQNKTFHYSSDEDNADIVFPTHVNNFLPTTTTTTASPVVDTTTLYNYSLKPNPNRRHSRGRRGLNTVEVLGDGWFEQLAESSEAFRRKASIQAREHNKTKIRRTKAFKKRGLRTKFDTIKPNKKRPTLDQQFDFAATRRKRTGTNFPTQAKRYARYFNEGQDQTPAKPLRTRLEIMQEAQKRIIKSQLGLFKRTGEYKLQPCCTKCVEAANETFKVLSVKQLAKLIAILLQRGCVETHPGPFDKSSKAKAPKYKPGQHMGRKNLAAARRTTQPNILRIIKPDSPLDHRIKQEPAATECEDLLVEETAPTKPEEAKTQPKPKEPKDDEDFDPVQLPLLRGHNMTSTELQHVVMSQFHGDPRTVQRERKMVQLTEDHRLVVLRGVKHLSNNIEIERITYTGVRQYLHIWRLPELLCLARMSNTPMGLLEIAWTIFKLQPAIWFIAMCTGFWLFSPIYWIFTLFIGQTAIFTLLRVLRDSKRIWGKVTFAYVPHMLSVMLTDNLQSLSKVQDIPFTQSWLRSSCINIPDSQCLDWHLATVKCARGTFELMQGFRELPEANDGLQNVPEDTSTDSAPTNDGYLELASGLPEIRQDACFKDACKQFFKTKVSELAPSTNIMPLATDTPNVGSQTGHYRTTEMLSERAGRATHVLKTTAECALEPYQDMAQSLLTAMMQNLVSKASTNESEEVPSMKRPKLTSVNSSNLPRKRPHQFQPYQECLLKNLSANSIFQNHASNNTAMPTNEIVMPDLHAKHLQSLKDLSNSNAMIFTSTLDGSTPGLTSSRSGVDHSSGDLNLCSTTTTTSSSTSQSEIVPLSFSDWMSTKHVSSLLPTGPQWKNTPSLESSGLLSFPSTVKSSEISTPTMSNSSAKSLLASTESTGAMASGPKSGVSE